MKRKTAKEILAESFREVAETKSIDKITIRDIVDNCGYSPATFYRQFSDKYDLIAWDYVDRTKVIIDKVGVNAYQWKHTWADAVKFYSENREYILNLLKNTAGHDAFVRYLSEANIRHLTRCVLKLNGRKELDNDTLVYIRIYCCGTAMTICSWLMGEIICDENDLAALLVQALPLPLKPLLYRE
jgi:AcrR family transcriptional regulator